jgi:hypothetical protein
MTRWLLRLLALVSLLLTLVTAGVWVQSYLGGFFFGGDWPPFTGIDVGGYGVGADSYHGKVCFRWAEHSREKKWFSSVYMNTSPNYFAIDVHIAPAGKPAPLGNVWASHGVVGIRCWFAMLASLLLIVPWVFCSFRERRIRGRSRQGLCPKCGYDLRATPARCPECGTRVEPPPGAAVSESQ